jgi:hypothetical protein
MHGCDGVRFYIICARSLSGQGAWGALCKMAAETLYIRIPGKAASIGAPLRQPR